MENWVKNLQKCVGNVEKVGKLWPKIWKESLKKVQKVYYNLR